ncbi:unnamed protein product [Bursaphelenchus xylophilus]|uniref:(pine wood nematode) hypothetical protein n=1 Tax=Bursaphelenchus xylophilus TaxID=6326 RepID=A0A1I7SEI3_BURXY|nr:unnamed protein product [Bursaphelenchus xylophilus]CAG9113519.1 unnamed protein product [Bursaphelenchus xylophilus]
MRAALVTVAAGLTTEERDQVCYTLPELISTCMIDTVACDMTNDFKQVYDVDYGYCYTFNHYTPSGRYNTTSFDNIHGLVVIMTLNVSDYLQSTEFEGGKVVLHVQTDFPFPNVDGYFVRPGYMVDHVISQSQFSRLSHPYGDCDDLDSLKKRDQPFYFDGDYSTEGCLRSCFQQKVVAACGCADSRFPVDNSTSNATFCAPLETSSYDCYTDYISENGDYYNVSCQCAFPCADTQVTAELRNAVWPTGNFFFDQDCRDNMDCLQVYRENNVRVRVYYVEHGYDTIQESPAMSAFDLINNLYGNTGLWIGWCVLSIAEFLLVFLQLFTCICRTRKEVPEVPSCRRRNYPEDEEEPEQEDFYPAPHDVYDMYFGSHLPNMLRGDCPKRKRYQNMARNAMGHQNVDLKPYCIDYEQVIHTSAIVNQAEGKLTKRKSKNDLYR